MDVPARIKGIYLDNNATTYLSEPIKAYITQLLNLDLGNPSSNHEKGKQARFIIDESRNEISNLLHCSPEKLSFNSGGTEGNNQVLNNLIYGEEQISSLLTTKVEHSSILKKCDFLARNRVKVEFLDVNKDGSINLDELKKRLHQSQVSLVSIGWVNSETGVIQPIKEIGKICQKFGVRFHTDASQAVGRFPIELETLPIDYLTFSGHKLHAPKGIGVLYQKGNNLLPLIWGGDQEEGLRAGTENILGIGALGEACFQRNNSLQDHLIKMRDLRGIFEKELMTRIEDIQINGHNTERVVNTSNITFLGIDGRALVSRLSSDDVYCSQTSACTSMIPEPSYVLRAMGLSSEDAFSSLRFSFEYRNTKAEVLKAVDIIEKHVKVIRSFFRRVG